MNGSGGGSSLKGLKRDSNWLRIVAASTMPFVVEAAAFASCVDEFALCI